MEEQDDFRQTYNTMNLYDRMNMGDIVISPDNNQSMFPIDYRHYIGNQVFPVSADTVSPTFTVSRSQSDHFGMNFSSENICHQNYTTADQSRQIERTSYSDQTSESTDNAFVRERNPTNNSNFMVKGSTLESKSNTQENTNSRECFIKDESNEFENDIDKSGEQTEENQEIADKSIENKTTDKLETDVGIADIKEEPITDDEDHDEEKETTSDVSDASTIIEDEDEIADKINKKRRKSDDNLQDEQENSTRKKPRKQKMPKIVLPKDKKEFTCEICAKVVQTLRALEKHRNLHTEKFKCTECNKIFNSEVSLKNHSKVHAGFIGNEVCNVCDKTFYDKSSLNKHTLSVHMGIKNFQCEFCNLSFFAKKTYEEHVRVHTGERPFKCTLCPKSYKRIADLNHHVRLHKGEVSHTCDKCGEGFRRVSELNRHMSTKHDDRTESTASPFGKPKNCSWCGLVFSTMKALNEHFKTHMESIKTAQIDGQKPVTFQHDEMKLAQDIVQEFGTNLAGPGFSGIVPEDQTVNNRISIGNDWNLQTQTRMPMNQGIDMTYRSMTQAPNQSEQVLNTEKQEKVRKVDKIIVNDKAKLKDANKVNDKPYTRTFGMSKVEVACESGQKGVDQPPNVYMDKDVVSVKDDDFMKSETEVYIEYDDESDNYAGDTDVEDYNYMYVIDQEVVTDKAVTQTVSNNVQMKDEADDGFDSEINDKIESEDDSSKDPNFSPEDQKVSKRKTARPKRKKKQNKKEIIEMSDKEHSEKEKQTKKKNKRSKTAKNDQEETDESMDLEALKCLQCGKFFSKKITLIKHMNLHRGTYSCETCGKCFSTKKSLMTHVDNHEGRKVNSAKCNVCDKLFYDSSSMNKHVKTVHMDYKPFPCTMCERRFPEQKTLNEHLRVHTGERPFACEVCGKTYKRSSELNFHIRKHSGEVNLNCPECGKGFIRMGQLRQHMSLRHDKERPFRCFLCAKTFPTHVMLKDHQKIHVSQKKHVCEKCGSKFHTKSKLEKHLRRKTDCQVDLGINADGLFVCKYCESEFSTIEERQAHLEEVHKNDKRRIYPCELCGKQFRRSQTLKIHLKIHYQVRDFKCTMCSAAFIQRHHLTQHLATHTGSRPYQCQICLKNFAHSATLYNHMKHH